MNNREDLDYLINGANPEEFSYTEALEAYHNLMDTFLDMEFQRMSSELDFKGSDREAWLQKLIYKRNRTVEAAKRFSRRVRELKESGAQAKLEKIASLLQDHPKSSESFTFLLAVKEVLNGR